MKNPETSNYELQPTQHLLQVLDTCARPVNERPHESTDLASVIEIYTASIRVLAAPYYSPEQIAAWAPVPPDAAR